MQSEIRPVVNLMYTLFYLVNLLYAFKIWGIGHFIANIFIPYALLWDTVAQLVK